jgi:RNA polymerase sigma-70 factor (ECF subfamily)
MSENDTETLIRNACEARRYERAATLTIEHYGPELLGFLTSQLRDEEAADEVFAEFSAAFWEGLPRFEWRCSVRTWAYKLARRTAGRHRKRARRDARLQPLTQLSQLSQAVERVRSATRAYKRTAVKDRFQELRAALPEEDQALLVLRVDRGLSWLELAEVMLDNEAEPTELRLKTEAARLRKRFQLAKERLRELVAQAGLLEN